MKRPRAPLLLALVLLPGIAADAAAQGSPPGAGRQRPPAQVAAAPTAPEASEVRIRADTQGGSNEHYWFRGFVDLQARDLRIQSDQLDFYRDSAPEGKTTQRIVAQGNVVFMRGEERMSGRHLEMDLDSGKGTFQDAFGYVQPGVFVEAKTIRRVDADTYRIEGGKFTSCHQPNPRWSFSASSARLEVDDKIVARNVLFKVKQVPAFYIPIFAYPIQEDQRSSGFLFPHFGHSSARGFNVGGGFFWAMGRSLDQTFYVDNYSQFGHGLGHELRWALRPPSRGTFRSYGFRPKAGGEWDYDLDWNAVHTFPGGVRASVQVRQYSNLAFQQRFQDNLDLATRRTRRSLVSLQKTLGNTTIRATADSNETFFPGRSRVLEHLPSVQLSGSPTKLGRTGLVLSYEARGERLGFGDEGGTERFSRFDLSPRLSRPIAVSFLRLTPEVQVRHTRYGVSSGEEGFNGPPLDRRFFETSLEMLGPTFARVFDVPGGFYSERYKHVIGPEVRWTYRSRVDDFDLIPKFDGEDYYLGTNEVNYGIVQRFYAKRPGRSGRLEPYEFLTWRVSQTYYVQIGSSQNEFDPNYSSAAFGVGGLPDHNSPVQSRLRFRPTRQVASNFDLEYDVNFKVIRALGISGTIDYERLQLRGGWSRARRLAVMPENRILVRDTLRASSRIQLVPRRLTVEGSVDWDVLRKNLVQTMGRVRYDVQCCGFSAEVIQSDFNIKQDRQFRFSIDLANIGSIGNFMGDDANQGRVGFAGLR